MNTIKGDPLPGSRVFFHSPTPLAKETFFYPICLGHYFCREDYEISRSSFDSYLLMYILKGEGYVSTPDASYQFQEHQAVLVDCYHPHTYGASSDLEFYWVHFDGVCAQKYFQHLCASCDFPSRGFPISLSLSGQQEINRLFFDLLQEFQNTGCSEIRLGKQITDLLTLLDPSSVPEPNALKSNAPAEAARSCSRAAAYMRQHFTRPLSIEEIAASVSLSPYHFIRQFKLQYGMTPHQYLLSLRLDCARFYLRTTAKTVKEIGFACGFQSENSFCIAFKKQAGVTPTCYRNQ